MYDKCPNFTGKTQNLITPRILESNEARISKKAKMKRKLNRNQKRITP